MNARDAAGRWRERVPATLIAGVAAIAIVVTGWAGLGDLLRHPTAALVKSDFQSFYCGAAVARAHGDPYALTPLQRCQAHRLEYPGGVDPASAGVDPDPLPGYDMAFFEPLTWLPFRTAALIWDGLLVGAIVATAVLLGRICRLSPLVIGAALSYADAVANIRYGQIPPVLTLALVVCAYGLIRKRQWLALVGAAGAMLEPHVGLPVGCALFVWRPNLRLGLLAVALVLAGVSVAALGLPLNAEYVRVELPTHAQAEATTAIQYSLTWLLHWFGVDDATAIRIGTIQYGASAAVAVAGAGFVARRLGTPAALALFPAAFVLIGGSFIHIVQMTAALPFALLLATRLRGSAALAAWFAVALLAVAWPSEWHFGIVGAVAVLATIVLHALRGRRLVVAAITALAVGAVYVVLAGPVLRRFVPALPQRGLAIPAPMPRALDGDRLASDEDAREAQDDPDFALATPRTLAAKVPTWLALCTLAGLAAFPSRRAKALPETAP